MLTVLGARLGVQFTPVPVESWEDALNKARNREADILARAAPTPEREAYMSFVTGYLELPGSIFARATSTGITTLDDLKGKKVAVVSGYLWQSLLAGDHPEIVVVPVTGMEQALEMVAEGTADALIANPVSASHYMRKKEITALVPVGETGYQARYAIAIRKDWPEFKAILEKVRYSITEEEIQAVLDQWLDDLGDGAQVIVDLDPPPPQGFRPSSGDVGIGVPHPSGCFANLGFAYSPPNP